jgi:membrane protease YdiL (CAAX protease family)
VSEWSYKDRSREGRALLSRIGLALIVLLSIQIAARLGLQAAAQRFPELLHNEILYWLFSTIPTYLLAFPGALVTVRTLPAPAAEKPRYLPPRLFLRAWLICFAGLYLSNLVTMLIIGVISRATVTDFINPVQFMAQWPAWLIVLVGCILAPAMEELLFRREILRRLRPFGEKFAVLSSALLFALAHANPYQFLYAFVAGVCFAYVALRTGSILQTFLLHAMFNGLSAVMIPLMNQADVLETFFLTGTYVILIAFGLFEFMFFRNDPVLPRPEKETAAIKKWGLFLTSPGILVFLLLMAFLFLRATLN